MSRLVLVLASAFALTACASDSRPLSPQLDPSNPDAPESPPIVASTTLSPSPTASSPAHAGHDAADAGTHQVFTCPMHPEVQSDKPGDCPKCGMHLVPQKTAPSTPGANRGAKKPAPSAKSAPIVYSCPMHPEVRSDKPGKCPKCGMNLVPVEPVAADAGTADEHQHHRGTP